MTQLKHVRRHRIVGLGRAARFSASVLMLAATACLLGHDDPNHHHDSVDPYDGPGWDGGSGGQIPLAFPTNNVHLLSWLPLTAFGSHSSANDCWGYVSPSGREYAIIGLRNGTGFVDITNPSNPVVVAVMAGPSSLWRDMKTYQHYCYAVSEGGQGIQVFDLAQIDDGIVTHVGNFTQAGTLTTASTHTVFIDTESGYLYRNGGGGGTIGLRIYSLANPESPTFVGEWHNRYVHDSQVVVWHEGPYAGRQIAFCYANNVSNGGNPGVNILDVTDKSNIVQLGFTSWSFPAFSHQGWLTEDRRFVLVNDELAEVNHGIPTTTRVINVEDLTNPYEASTFTNGNTAIGHNIYVRGNLSFHANYRSGLRVFDVSDPINAVEIGSFDTWVEDDNPNFNGLWSPYPFFPSGVVIGSDIEKGLFVWWVGDLPLTYEYPETRPEMISPSGDSFTVRIITAEGFDVDTARLIADAGDGSFEVPLVSLGKQMYRADFPSLPCGRTVNYYLTATTTTGFTRNDPSTAPAIGYSAIIAEGLELAFEDIFDSDLGWSVGAPDDDATAGIWERANPVGTTSGGQQVQPNAPFLGDACYITGQHPGGGAGANDVDNGKTTLFSPVFKLADNAETVVSYWRWYSNHAGANPHVDVFRVDITGDDGKSWVNVETVGPDGPETRGGWYFHEFRVTDFIANALQFHVRFIASDYDPQALVEAAIDAFRITVIECNTPSTCLADLNSDGTVDVLDLLNLLGSWGSCKAGCPADLNEDHVVDVLDLLILLGAWGSCPTP